jgi:hypothetical protein
MPRANRHFLPNYVWHMHGSFASMRPPHRHILVLNTPLSQERFSVHTQRACGRLRGAFCSRMARLSGNNTILLA